MAQDVRLYSLEYCRHCEAAKDYLRQLGISFKEVVVQRHQSEFRKLQLYKGAGSPPVITVNGSVIF